MNWDEYFLKIAEVTAEKSKDNSTKIGCVIVGPDNEIRSLGYNGFPRGVRETSERVERPTKYVFTEHSERNAIYNASRVGIPLKGCRIYALGPPCVDCARGIIQAGIIEVIEKKNIDLGFRERWAESIANAEEMFSEAGVSVRYI